MGTLSFTSHARGDLLDIWAYIAAQNLPAADPYPRGPWLKESDLHLEIRYTLTNLDDQPHTVLMMIDPWNEFVRYKLASSSPRRLRCRT